MRCIQTGDLELSQSSPIHVCMCAHVSKTHTRTSRAFVLIAGVAGNLDPRQETAPAPGPKCLGKADFPDQIA